MRGRNRRSFARGTESSNPSPSTGESTANLSFRVGIASMTVGCEEIRRARHRHVTVGAYYKRAVRRLAQEATMPAPRDRLADVALQYEKLAEGAHAGCRHPGSWQERIARALTGSRAVMPLAWAAWPCILTPKTESDREGANGTHASRIHVWVD